jgi:hypothetical protein
MATRVGDSAWRQDYDAYRRRLRAMLRLASTLDMRHPTG